MMAQAGYDPRGLSSFLRNLRTRERLTGLGYHGLVASHPDTAMRIAKADIMAQLLVDRQSFNDLGEEVYKTHLVGLPFGPRHERRRLDLYRVEEGETLASVRAKVMAPDETVWEVASLNRLRSKDALQPGMLLKVVVADGRPVGLPRRQLDISADRPLPVPPPALPQKRPQGPYRGR
jgi:predicted Zn-dependent protease